MIKWNGRKGSWTRKFVDCDQVDNIRFEFESKLVSDKPLFKVKLISDQPRFAILKIARINGVPSAVLWLLTRIPMVGIWFLWKLPDCLKLLTITMTRRLCRSYWRNWKYFIPMVGFMVIVARTMSWFRRINELFGLLISTTRVNKELICTRLAWKWMILPGLMVLNLDYPCAENMTCISGSDEVYGILLEE